MCDESVDAIPWKVGVTQRDFTDDEFPWFSDWVYDAVEEVGCKSAKFPGKIRITVEYAVQEE